MEDQLVCPVCVRMYELPRRYMIREDDINYFVAPRFLDCLHTCCHSCLEEIWEKNNCEGVCCPQCNHYQNLRSVKYLPLDGSAISQLIPLNGASLSFCSRCRDEVPSFSWCEVCCTTLCEFHHQDHKLSAESAKHSVLTFKVISQEKLTIKPRMPPINCPEELEQDATLYCHDCNLLVSAQAMLTKHSSHQCSEGSSLFDWANDLIKYTISSTLERQNGLIKAIRGIKSNIDELQRNKEMAEEEIRNVFNDLRRNLDERERKMLERLEAISSRKHSILESQLEEMGNSLETCRHTIFVAESLLKKTENIEGREPYVVSAAYTISRRGEEIEEEIVDIPFEAQTHPFIRSYFVQQELFALQTVLTSLGGLLTHDNIPEDESKTMTKKKNTDIETKSETKSDTKSEIDTEIETKTEPESKNSEIPQSKFKMPQISFTIQTRTPPKLSIENQQSTSKEAVIIEARLKMFDKDSKDSIVSQQTHLRDFVTTPDTLNIANRIYNDPIISNPSTEHSLEHLLGDVIGQVIFLTEIDNRIMKKHLVRSNYDSFITEVTELPTLRVTREIISGS